MMMNEHTAKAFDVDLQEITRMVAEMGGLAEKQIADSVDALVRRDVERARRVVALDAELDTLQRGIEDKAVLTIARRQPMAVDLREVVGALRAPYSGSRLYNLDNGRGHDGIGRVSHCPGESRCISGLSPQAKRSYN